jgi:hypothetical protein
MGGFFGPFDHADGVLVEKLPKPRVMPFLLVAEPIQIKVIEV